MKGTEKRDFETRSLKIWDPLQEVKLLWLQKIFSTMHILFIKQLKQKNYVKTMGYRMGSFKIWLNGERNFKSGRIFHLKILWGFLWIKIKPEILINLIQKNLRKFISTKIMTFRWRFEILAFFDCLKTFFCRLSKWFLFLLIPQFLQYLIVNSKQPKNFFPLTKYLQENKSFMLQVSQMLIGYI